MDNTSAKEQLLRTASLETSSLRQEIDSVVRTKENVVLENRRVQDELASCAAYCRSTQNELEAAKRQIDDLKRQLQHYVAEVKRFEDMMSKKEMERAEILDQFKSLSQEANDLEHNNHTLENEATQSKVQLSVTLDHVADLEHNLTTQADMINSYEKKIKDLSSQIAETNLQLNRHKQQHDRCEADLNSLRDLCMRLDKQKETLIQDLQSKDEHRSNVDKDVTRLRCECETLQACLSKDRITIENLERLLSESRQESVRQKILNDDLDVELRRLKQKVEELQKVRPTTQQTQCYQEYTYDYNRETDRGGCFKKKDDVAKRYPSL